MITSTPQPASPWAMAAPFGFTAAATLLLYLAALNAQLSPLHAVVPIQPGIAHFTWLFALASLTPLACLVWAWFRERVALAMLFAALAVPGVCFVMVCAYTTDTAATTCPVPRCGDSQPYPTAGFIAMFAMILAFLALIATIVATFAALDKLVHAPSQGLRS